MTDTPKLDPTRLSTEERAIFVDVAARLMGSGNYTIAGASLDAMDFIAHNRALFSPPAAAKAGEGAGEMKCTNCGGSTAIGNHKWIGYPHYEFVCHRPAPQPEPVATRDWRDGTDESVAFDLLSKPSPSVAPVEGGEMPEAISDGVKVLREFASMFLKRDSFYSARDSQIARDAADALDSFWRSQPKSAGVAMTPELAEVLRLAECAEQRWRKDQETDLGPDEEEIAIADEIARCIAAVRAQATQAGGRRRLEKVRKALTEFSEVLKENPREVITTLDASEWLPDIEAALAELDQHERGER
jgi:hypothetical protein